MTTEQSVQYEICKKRRHEEAPLDPSNVFNTAMAQNAASPWKTCRWCGTQYQEVTEKRQVERA